MVQLRKSKSPRKLCLLCGALFVHDDAQNETIPGPELAENNGSGSLIFSFVYGFMPPVRGDGVDEFAKRTDPHILEKKCQWDLPDECQGEPTYNIQLIHFPAA